MKFDKDFDVDDIKAVRNVKNFAEKHNIKGVVKKYSKKIESAMVIAALGVICMVSITAGKTSDVPSDGRMLSVSDVKAEAVGFDNSVDKVSYEDMVGLKFESDQYAKIEVSEKNYETVLLAKDQDEKNKQALRQLELEKQEEIKKEAEAKKAEEERQRAEAERKRQAEHEDYAVLIDATDDEATTEVVPEDSDTGDAVYYGEFEATAYCSCSYCCGKSDGITASGTYATAGRTVAADTSVFPFGTRLLINGHVYVVEDVGGAIGGYRLDIYFDSHQDALNWGRRTVSVYVLK
ncbi:3D (Asp-Asp-Asp) domain-containing protein [Eubacterium ruminantium]|nr:3D (Asp-Asp-Asp) domain-containing protein [Eubacterium ruminantium]